MTTGVQTPVSELKSSEEDSAAVFKPKIQPAQAGFLCVAAVSTAFKPKIQPAQAGFVCVDAVLTARSN
jgi:hypothetical protein